ncbi:hypothetical protein HYU13_02315 [Candidatus Woesearchaeota archaeon]|nr:hypothetical protein [Candidatus Woesearchaeota archaeon]
MNDGIAYTKDKQPSVRAIFAPSEDIFVESALSDGIPLSGFPLTANIIEITSLPELSDGQHTLALNAAKRIGPGSFGILNKYALKFVVDTTPPTLQAFHTIPHTINYTNPIVIDAVPSDVHSFTEAVNLTLIGPRMPGSGALEASFSTASLLPESTIQETLTQEGDGHFRYNLTGLSLGEYNLTLSTADTAGNVKSINYTFVVVDGKAPSFNVVSPPAVSKSKDIPIEIVLSDISAILETTFSLNGFDASALVSRNGNNFLLTPPAFMLRDEREASPPENNKLSITATDSFGNRLQKDFKFTIFTQEGDISKLSLKNTLLQNPKEFAAGQSVNAPETNGLFCIMFASPVNVSPATLILNSFPGAIIEQQNLRTETQRCYILNQGSLIEGGYLATLSSAGGPSPVERQYAIPFSIDRTAPHMSLPAIPSATKETQLLINGSVEPLPANVFANGHAASFFGNSFSSIANLSIEGINFITFNASDPAGNAEIQQFTVIRDTLGPRNISFDPFPNITGTNAITLYGETEQSATISIFDENFILLGTITANPQDQELGADTTVQDASKDQRVLLFRGDATGLMKPGRFVELDHDLRRIRIQQSQYANPVTSVMLDDVLYRDVKKSSTLARVFNTSLPAKRFSMPLSLNAGNNQFNIIVNDTLGNTMPDIKTLNIFLDTEGPSITGLEPVNGAQTSNNQTSLRFQITDAASAINASLLRLTINGPCTITPLANQNKLTFQNGVLSFAILGSNLCDGKSAYLEGSYTATAIATDVLGNSNTLTTSFEVNTSAPSDPTITITGGKSINNSFWFVGTETFIATLLFPDTQVEVISMSLDGAPLARDAQFIQEAPNRFVVSLAGLSDGQHILAVRAAKTIGSQQGRESTSLTSIVVDKTTPTVSVAAPYASSTRSITLGITLIESNLKSLTINGDVENAPLDITSSFKQAATGSIPVNLSDTNGTKTISIRAEDSAGNIAINNSQIILDQEMPAVSLTATNASGQPLPISKGVPFTYDSSARIQCTCSDSRSGCTGTINTFFRISPSGTYAAMSSPLLELGSLTSDRVVDVMCRAPDKAGNIGQANGTILFDKSAPSLSSIVPSTGFTNHQLNPITIETDDIAACEHSLRSDFLNEFVQPMPTEGGLLHQFTFDLAEKDVNWFLNNPKTFSYFVKCTNSAGQSTPVTRFYLTADTSPLAIISITSAKPLFYNDNPANTITLTTNKEALCRFSTSGANTYAGLSQSMGNTYSLAHTISNNFSNGDHSIFFDCVDKANNTAQNPQSFNFIVNTLEAFQFLSSGPNGRIADRRPDLFVIVNKQGACRFNNQPATTASLNNQGNRLVSTNHFNITSTQADGFYLVPVDCNDINENFIYTTISYTINTTPPLAPSLTQPPPSGISSFKGTLAVSGTAEEGVVKVNAYLNGLFAGSIPAVNREFIGVINTSSMPDGSYLLEVEAEFPNGEEFRSPRDAAQLVKDTISSPPSLSLLPNIVGSQTLTISGTAESGAQVFIYRNVSGNNSLAGETTATQQGNFTVDIPLLTGENGIFGQAIDAAQNPPSANSPIQKVNLDITGPSITIASPGQSYNENTVAIRAAVTDIGTVNNITVLINTTPEPYYFSELTSNLNATAITFLHAPYLENNGSYLITIAAKDTFGNIGSASKQFVLDTSMPDPAQFNLDGRTVNVSNPSLIFSFTEPVNILELNGVAPTGNQSTESRVFTFTTASLADGAYDLFIIAASTSGQGTEGNFSFNITVDTTPPAAGFRNIQQQFTTEQITLNGTCSDNIDPANEIIATLFQDNAIADLPFNCSGGVFTRQIYILGGDGQKNIRLEARDRAGNAGTANATINLDRGFPSISIHTITNNADIGGAPAAGQTASTKGSFLSINGNVSDDNLDSLTAFVNNTKISGVSFNKVTGAFQANISLAGANGKETNNHIVLLANDTFGQTGIFNFTIVKDLLGPQLTTFEPATNATASIQPSISFTTHEAASPCMVTYPMQATTGSRTDTLASTDSSHFAATFSTPIKHTPAGTSTQTIGISCTDALGNTAIHSRPLRTDLENPTITSFDIDYFAKMLFETTSGNKSFLITNIPPGASLKITAQTNEDAVCSLAAAGISQNLSPSPSFGRMHNSSFIPIIDPSNSTFTISCKDTAGRQAQEKGISVLANSALEVSAPIIFLEHPFVQSNLAVEQIPTVSTRTPTFNGSIISFTPGVTIISGMLTIGGTTYDLPRNAQGKFSRAINPLPAEGEYNFTITAQNSQGNISTLQGRISVDTQGPGGCVIVSGQQSCSQIAVAKMSTAQNTFGIAPASASGSCGDGLCAPGEHCLNDCIIATLPGYVGGSEEFPDDIEGQDSGVTLYTGNYLRNNTLFIAFVYSVLSNASLTELLEEVNSPVGLQDKTTFNNKKILRRNLGTSVIAAWISQVPLGNYYVGILEPFSPSDIPNDILTSYLNKYQSTLT